MSVRIAFLCTYSTPPRTLRMAKILARAGYDVHIIEWDRSGSKPKLERADGITFKRLKLKAGYGLRIFYLIPIWLLFSLIQLMLKNYTLMQPQNLDCLIPAFLVTRFSRRRRIIYDLADFYGHAYLVGFPIISQLASIVERLLIRRVDALILVSERQLLQIGTKNLPKNLVYFYNAPEVDVKTVCRAENRSFSEHELTFDLFYGGILSYDRVRLLVNVINAVKGLPVKVIIAGFGECEGILKSLSESGKQVVFLGRLSHKKLLEYTMKANAILLPYDPRILNCRIGLPNKLFEAMLCESLILAPHGTYMAEIVKKYQAGIVIDYNDVKELRKIIKETINIQRNKISLILQNAKKLFFKKYNPRKMARYYLELVNSLATK